MWRKAESGCGRALAFTVTKYFFESCSPDVSAAVKVPLHVLVNVNVNVRSIVHQTSTQGNASLKALEGIGFGEIVLRARGQHPRRKNKNKSKKRKKKKESQRTTRTGQVTRVTSCTLHNQ